MKALFQIVAGFFLTLLVVFPFTDAIAASPATRGAIEGRVKNVVTGEYGPTSASYAAVRSDNAHGANYTVGLKGRF
jgi:hypothetical protein